MCLLFLKRSNINEWICYFNSFFYYSSMCNRLEALLPVITVSQLQGSVVPVEASLERWKEAKWKRNANRFWLMGRTFMTGIVVIYLWSPFDFHVDHVSLFLEIFMFLSCWVGLLNWEVVLIIILQSLTNPWLK